MLLTEINSRDVEAIRTHISEIEKVLGREIDGLDTLLFGGSLSKSTFVEGMSDVDALVFFDKSKYGNISPNELQDKMLSLMEQRFPHTEIKKGALAVTVKFHDYEIQLLPALREHGKLYIANRESNGWSRAIDSKAFSEKLTTTNQSNGKKVVPVIKLAKALFSNLPDRYRPSGYHVEALAVDAFANYSGRYTLYDMTKHLLNSDTSFEHLSNYFEWKNGSRLFVGYRFGIVIFIYLCQVGIEFFHGFLIANKFYPPPKT